MVLITVSILVKIQNISSKTAHAAPLVTVLTSRDTKDIKTTVMLLVILVSTCTSTEAASTNVTLLLLSEEVKEADFSVIIPASPLTTYIGMVLVQAATSPLFNSSPKTDHTVTILVLIANISTGTVLVLTPARLL